MQVLHWESLCRLGSLQTSLDHCHDACVATGGDGRKQPILLPRLVNLEIKHVHAQWGKIFYAFFVFSTRLLSFAAGPSSLPLPPCSFQKNLPSSWSSKTKTFRRGQQNPLRDNRGRIGTAEKLWGEENSIKENGRHGGTCRRSAREGHGPCRERGTAERSAESREREARHSGRFGNAGESAGARCVTRAIFWTCRGDARAGRGVRVRDSCTTRFSCAL